MSILLSLLIKSSQTKFNIVKTTRNCYNFLSKKTLGNDLFKNCVKQRNYVTQESDLTKIIEKKLKENSLKNILVYSCTSKGNIFVNLMSIAAGSTLLLMSLSMWSLLGSDMFKTSSRSQQETGVFKKILNLISTDAFKYISCTFVVVIGVSIMVFGYFFTSRSVNKVYLLKGSKSLGVITDGFFNRNMVYTLNLEETSFNKNNRMLRVPYIAFKNKNHYFYFLMNNVDGEYHEKEVFDHIICRNRD